MPAQYVRAVRLVPDIDNNQLRVKVDQEGGACKVTWRVQDGETVLVDYKTNSNTTAEMLIEEYRGQLEVYAHALSEATGMRVKQKLLYSFELGEVEVV